MTRIGTTSITTQIDVVREREVLVSGTLRHVCVATDTWTKTDLPDWIRDGLRPYAAADAERAQT